MTSFPSSEKLGSPEEPGRRLVARWLRLEAGEPDAQEDRKALRPLGGESLTLAEQALGQLLERLPPAHPGGAFAERVLVRTRRWAAQRHGARASNRPGPLGFLVDPSRWMGHWGARAAIALVAVQAGLLLAATLTVAPSMVRDLEPMSLITAAIGGLAGGLEWLAATPRLGVALTRFGETLAQTLIGSRAVLATLVVCVLSSATGLYLLSAVLPGPSRSRV